MEKEGKVEQHNTNTTLTHKFTLIQLFCPTRKSSIHSGRPKGRAYFFLEMHGPSVVCNPGQSLTIKKIITVTGHSMKNPHGKMPVF